MIIQPVKSIIIISYYFHICHLIIIIHISRRCSWRRKCACVDIRYCIVIRVIMVFLNNTFAINRPIYFFKPLLSFKFFNIHYIVISRTSEYQVTDIITCICIGHWKIWAGGRIFIQNYPLESAIRCN